MGKFLFWIIHQNKPIFNMIFIRFTNDPLFPKIMEILLLKYWEKIGGLSLSQYCKRFWLASCTGKFFILNNTSEESVYLECIWYLFFLNDPLLPVIMNIFIFKYWLKCLGPSISQSCKWFWLAIRICKTSVINRTVEISLFLTCISFFFRKIRFCQKYWRFFYSNIR